MKMEMMICPKCKRPVDNIETATCPHCFAPVAPVLVPDSRVVSSLDSLSQAPGFEGIPAHPSSVASVNVPPPPTPALPSSSAGIPGYAPPSTTGYAPPAAPGYAPRPVGEHSPLTETTFGAPNTPQSGGFVAPTSSLLTTSAYNSTHTPQKPGLNFGNLLKIGIGGGGALIYIVFRLGILAWGVNRIFNHQNGNSNQSSSAEIRNENEIARRGEMNPYLNNLRTPSSGAQAAINAIHTHDWRKLYYVSSHSGEENKDSYSAAAYVEEMTKQRTGDHDPTHLFNVIGNATSYKVLPGIEKSGKSDVQTVWQLNYNGKKIVSNGVAHMIKTEDGWELNSASFVNKIFSDLVGDSEHK